MGKEWWNNLAKDINSTANGYGDTVNRVSNSLTNQISNYNSTLNSLGLGVYDGLLAKKLQTNVTKTTTISENKPIVHSDNAVNDEFYDTNGVYYVNYTNIYNTLNRNIGGSSYMDGNYDIIDEGNELGQRYPIYFESYLREEPTFISDKERDSYVNYINYMSDYFGNLSYNEKSLLAEKKGGYNVGVVRSFNINGSTNPNGETDTLLGKMSSAILGNIITQRNIRKSERGFPSITNINYYDKGRTDIESSSGIESLDTAMGISSSRSLPNFGIKSEYALIEFGEYTDEYGYSARTDNYSLFDAWGELTNSTISLSNSPAFNSMNKSLSFSFGDDSSTIYLSDDKSLDISQFLIQNLKYKGGLHNSDSFVTYFGKHNFDVYIDDTSNKSRYLIYTNGADESTYQHVDFHYDEGALTNDYGLANLGTNNSTYITYKNTNNFGKDLLNVTNNAFRNAKHKTIISKFYTNYGQGEKRGKTPFQSAVTKKYGMSHGRNLLKKKPTNENGYENPYCRVWTYHHQYSRLCDTIRPFTERIDETCSFSDKSDVRQYINEIAKHRNGLIKYNEPFDIKDRKSYQMAGYSEGQDLLAEYSVINKYNGLVNITPTTPFDPDGRKIKTKQCMFSIENLAWKDIEKDGYNLSDDQIGPLGGRIMWFPPYGLSFNENVSANWNSVSFIGRGENMYTYTNTERGGSLSFIMLIDHPSILNEWNNETGATGDVDDIESTEQKILRFFAGCELLEPLADRDDSLKEKKEASKINEEPIQESRAGHFSFCVYFPNNYSGNLESDPEVAVSYLLNGVGYGLLSEENEFKDNPKLIPNSYDILNYKYAFNVDEVEGDSIDEAVKKLTDNNEKNGELVKKFTMLYINSKKYEDLITAPLENLRDIIEECIDDSDEYLSKYQEIISEDQYVYEKTKYLEKKLKEIDSKYQDLINKASDDTEKNKLAEEWDTELEKLEKEEKEVTEKAKEEYGTTYQEDYQKDAIESYAKVISENDSCNLYRIGDFITVFNFDPTLKEHFDGKSNQELNKLKYLYDYEEDFIVVQSNENMYYAYPTSTVSEYEKLLENSNIGTAYKQISSLSNRITENSKGNPFSNRNKASISAYGGYEMTEQPYNGISMAFSNSQLFDEIATGNTDIFTIDNKYKSKIYNLFFCCKNDDDNYEEMKYYLPKSGKSSSTFKNTWGYRVDEGKVEDSYNPFNDTVTYNLDGSNGQEVYNACTDSISYGLNAKGFYQYKDNIIVNHPSFNDDWENMYSFADVFAAINEEHANDYGIVDNIDYDNVNVIRELIKNGISKIEIAGVASVQGEYVGSNLNHDKQNEHARNNSLSLNRGRMIQTWLKQQKDFKGLDDSVWPEKIEIVERVNDSSSKNVSEFSMKNTRCAIVTIHYGQTETQNAKDSQNQKYLNSGDTYGSNDYYDNGLLINQHTDDGLSDLAENNNENGENDNKDDELISIRYDNEETFFKLLEANEPLLHHRIVDKIKYFDPAFHSITPEGFGARLTFLHQCTRQGNTVGASDNGVNTTATNLAFGRPPVCVLRIGDFYNTKIIIESLSINYENGNGIQWDMNLEGIGLMPMYAKIDINFKFIGGSDLAGPINRLQNAVSFNYYANTRVYDNRSDGVLYDDNGNVTKINAWNPFINKK